MIYSVRQKVGGTIVLGGISADPNDFIAKQLRGGIFYEHDLLAALAPHLNGELALDIGAHVGNHTAFMGAFGPVLAVEPQLEVATHWMRTVAHSGVEALLCPRPLGAEEGLRYGSKTFDDNTGRAQFRPAQHGEVLSTTVDRLVAGRRVCVLKIDVEGHEGDILQGAVETLRQGVVVAAEAHNRYAMQAIEQVLAPLGYKRGRRYCASPTYLYKRA